MTNSCNLLFCFGS